MSGSYTDEVIGQYVQRLRTEQHLSVAKLAALTGLSANALRWIERGVTQPKPESLKALSVALGVTYENLLRRAGYLDRVERTDEETELLGLYHALPLESQNLLLEVLRVVARMTPSSEAEERH